MSGKDGSGHTGNAPLQQAAWVEPGEPAGEIRIGEPRLVKGGASVSTFTEEAAVADEAPLDRGRFLSDSEVAERGLLQERVIEIGEMREEAVVSKQAFIREEVVVRKDVEERTERIAETVRRTELHVETLEESAGGEDAEAPNAG
ncbi:MAG TPA: DUF2382 domain-containing protein [Allosphingosinicella sp.]|jgi:uncharacterized protein (TIGR02271 family)